MSEGVLTRGTVVIDAGGRFAANRNEIAFLDREDDRAFAQADTVTVAVAGEDELAEVEVEMALAIVVKRLVERQLRLPVDDLELEDNGVVCRIAGQRGAVRLDQDFVAFGVY